MNFRSPYFVLAWIWWWPSTTLMANNTREVCELLTNVKLAKGMVTDTKDEKLLLKFVSSAKSACSCMKLTTINDTLKKGLGAFEKITGCVYAGHVFECLVAFDTLDTDLPGRLQLWTGQSDVGFVERSNELWKAWRFVTMPLLSAMTSAVTKWTEFLRIVNDVYRTILPVNVIQHRFLNAVESLNLYLNGKALEPTQRYTSAHEAYTRVGLVHAYLYQTVYGYLVGHGCSWKAWTESPLRPGNVEDPLPTRALMRQRVKTAVGALQDFYTKTKMKTIAKVKNSLHVASQADLAEHPDLFVKPGIVVMWSWNGVKTNVYHVHATMHTDYQDDTASLYNSLAKRTVVATFFTYLHQYLQLYSKYYMTKETTRFDKVAEDDPAMLKPIRTLIAKMAFFSEDNAFEPIVRIHSRIYAPPQNSGTLTVFDLQFTIECYLSVLHHTLEVHTNPILVGLNDVYWALIEMIDAMSFGLTWKN